MQHPGRIINTQSGIFEDEKTSPEVLKATLLRNKNKNKDKDKVDENLYIYACCLKNLN
jgi:hypothetical protein